MKKRIFKISVTVLAFVILGGALWLANGFFGNPVSVLLAKNTAQKHIEENYGGSDFFVEDVSFSFKDSRYYAHVSSPSSDDSAFSIVIRMNGRLVFDTYADRVTRRGNTADRLNTEYRRRVDAILDSSAFPFDVNIGFGELSFVRRIDMGNYDTPDYALVTDDLTLDGFYDVNALGAEAGELTLYIYDEEVSAERLAAILLELRGIFDASGVSFYKIDCVLEYPRSEDGGCAEGRVEVMGFAYADIYEDGLVERVTASDRAAKEYYAEQDAKK